MQGFARPIFVICILLTACQASRQNLPGGLALEEHVLSQAPSSDLFDFQPAEGSKDEILALHEYER